MNKLNSTAHIVKQSGNFLLFSLLLLICSCGAPAVNNTNKEDTVAYYTKDDYPTVGKIDAHVHIWTADTTIVHVAREDNFRMLTIVVDEDPGIILQEQYAVQHQKQFPQYVSFATSFTVDDWDSPDWSKKTIDKIKTSVANGAIGVKIYKNIGMTLKDKQGHFVMIDNPRFDEMLDYLTKANIPVIGHLGEPKDCWLPLDQMLINSNRKYYMKHPEFHMYAHPSYPSYEQQIAARDHMLEKHPQLQFVGAHLGSLEWNTDTLAMHLDKLPNMAVDMAARISSLQFLASKDWQKVHDFFIRYQDRLIYGTDRSAEPTSKTPAEVAKFIHDAWLEDWVFFTTSDTLHSSSFEGPFTGLRLPKTVIDKIYRTNAEKWFKGLNRP
ncbi:amidohydrolase family protein [Chitinophaga defluvii]|uniref:Amidohydrolase family protein n=1 Tax=Chitinophaga defluvii TaxID=3163343 RepID=A0ABV2T180_9BACT